VTLIALALAAAMAQPIQPTQPPLMPTGPVASAPRWSGEPGLCLITVTAADADGARITRQLYRILGDAEEGAERGPAFTAEQERGCAASPALDPDDPDDGRDLVMLIGSEDPNDGNLAIRIIRQALRGARDGTYADIACDAGPAPDGRAPECADPRRLLAGLDLRRLSLVGIDRPHGGLVYSVETMFDLPPGTAWALTIEAEISGLPTGSASVRLRRARLTDMRIFDVAEQPPPVE
jgi:hypothetical protein